MPNLPVQYISGSAAPNAVVEGLRETTEMLNRLPAAVMLAGLTGALQAAGKVLMDEVDRLTPIRLGFEGGDLMVEGGGLKAALMSEITLDSRYRGGRIEIGFGRLGYIANFVEYGHKMLSHDRQRELSGPRTPGGFVPAYPFMRRAFANSKERAIDAFVNSIRETLKGYKATWGMPSAAA